MFHGLARIAVPWPVHGRLKNRPRIDPSLIESVLCSPAVLADVDPTTLAASQSWILAEHVGYYLSGQWEYTGRTSADPWAHVNRFPLVLPDHQGRLTIVAGHHRAAAARLLGQPLRARVAAAPTSAAGALTPSLLLSPGEDPRTAHDELRARGLDEAEIAFAFHVARPGARDHRTHSDARG
jgi:hypothetical protein